MEHPRTTKNVGQPCVICGQPANAQATVEALQAQLVQEQALNTVRRDAWWQSVKELEAALDAERERYELLNVERNAIDDKRHVLHEQLANTIEAAARQEGELAETQALVANLKSHLSALQALVRAVASAPGKDWLEWQLKLGEALGATTPDSNQLGAINDMVSKGGDGE